MSTKTPDQCQHSTIGQVASGRIRCYVCGQYFELVPVAEPEPPADPEGSRT